MGKIALVATGFLAGLGAVLFSPTKQVLFTTLGLSRDIRPISDFQYDCRKITHPQLQACEDIYIEEVGRNAYLACSTPMNRKNWQPTVDRRRNVGRELSDHFSVLSLDEPGDDGLFGLRILQTSDYTGAKGDGVLDLHGFDVEPIGANKLRFFVVNHRPPIDAKGNEMDAEAVGCNSTVEVFEHTRGTNVLQYRGTVSDPLIQTPNRVAATGDNGFVMTNDKSAKVGLVRELAMFFRGGNIIHCWHGRCQEASPGSLHFPNGMTKSQKDGLYYVPSSSDGSVLVFALMPQGTLVQVDKIQVGMPMDNLSVDGNGDIWVAGFPKVLEMVAGFEDPLNTLARTTVLRIRKTDSGYKVEKMLEDRDLEYMGSITTVVHDTKTGRLFLGSVYAPFTTVCDRK